MADAIVIGPLPKVDRPVLLGVMWTLCGIAAVFVMARLTIRWRYLHRLFSDDYLTIAALIILIASDCLMTIVLPTMYEILLVSAGRMTPSPHFAEKLYWFQNCQFAYTFLFWTGLWTVKAAFLGLLYRLTDQLYYPRLAWRFIAVITAMSYIGCVVSYLFACSSGNGGVQCQASKEGTRLTLISLKYSTAVDICTDVSVMILPISLTIGLRMSLSQKAGLLAVLCLGYIIAVFAIIRATFNGSDQRTPELSWLTIWTSIESSVAVVVVCLASFKVLLSRPKCNTPRAGYYEFDTIGGSKRGKSQLTMYNKSPS